MAMKENSGLWLMADLKQWLMAMKELQPFKHMYIVQDRHLCLDDDLRVVIIHEGGKASVH